MKKTLVVAIFCLGSLGLSAQELGIRFGGVNGQGGAAFDAVFGTGPSRIHANLGFYDDLALAVLWDVLYEPLGNEEFYWYIGVGPTTVIGDVFWLGASGELGLEYRFDSVPLVIGADWRPTFWLIDETRFGPDEFGINVRWIFGG